MKIAIVMPVVLQNEILLPMTLEAAAHLTTRHEATLYVVANRLQVCSPEILQPALEQCFAGKVRLLHEAGVERTVAGGWNHGCQHARDEGAEYIAIVANDTRLRENCLDLLVDHGERVEADLWSGVSCNERSPIDRPQENGVDFTCFMIRPQSLDRHGLFDPNYSPAYFEDNDYYARVVLGGGECRVVQAAQFFHHGSMTVRHDPELAYHMRYRFARNRDYFRRKWGVARPANSREGVLKRYYRHPFNDLAKPLNWFPVE
jgi:GT2 family glycosyltransferase